MAVSCHSAVLGLLSVLALSEQQQAQWLRAQPWSQTSWGLNPGFTTQLHKSPGPSNEANNSCGLKQSIFVKGLEWCLAWRKCSLSTIILPDSWALPQPFTVVFLRFSPRSPSLYPSKLWDGGRIITQFKMRFLSLFQQVDQHQGLGHFPLVLLTKQMSCLQLRFNK